MQVNDMKVFHGLINYGTQAGLLAEGLRRKGVEAESYVWKDPFNRLIDYNLSETFSRHRIIRWCQKIVLFLKCFRKFNIFHFYYGRSFLRGNVDLPLYHLFKKKVVMEYLGTDVDLWLGYNGVDWRGRPINRVKLVKRVIKQSRLLDKQLVCSPHYYQFVDNSIIVPLAINISDYDYSPRNYNYNNLTFVHCPTNQKAKKTKEIEDALQRLKDEGYHFKYKRIENVTHQKLKEEYLSADVVIDQLNFWYGTVSVEAMALGRPVVAGLYNHYLLYDERLSNIPIINADVKNVYKVFKGILDGQYDLAKISRESRTFVERYHSLEAVTNQLLEIYKSL